MRYRCGADRYVRMSAGLILANGHWRLRASALRARRRSRAAAPCRQAHGSLPSQRRPMPAQEICRRWRRGYHGSNKGDECAVDATLVEDFCIFRAVGTQHRWCTGLAPGSPSVGVVEEQSSAREPQSVGLIPHAAEGMECIRFVFAAKINAVPRDGGSCAGAKGLRRRHRAD